MIGSTRRRLLRTLLATALLGGAVTASAGTAAAGETSAQLAGERVVYSYPGTTPPAALLTRIREGRAAGVIFFGENITDSNQIAAVVRQLRDAAAQSPTRRPLLLLTDQEGGKVRRLPGEPTMSQKQVGQAADPGGAATAAGTAAGRNLAGVGMNLNLAPVLDVYRTEGNFIDRYGRSYGRDPAQVGTLGQNFVRAQQGTGVAATVKHFPGLGAAPAGADTDAGPVTLNTGLSELRGTDEAPYPAAIAAGVKLVMTSWAVYPALDPYRPAGLSDVVVRQELRGRNHFTGVTVTDALEAGALRDYGDTGHRAVLAAGAGMDLILASARDVNQGDAAAAALAASLDNGTLPRADFTAAVDRITALRNGLH